jgi:hypothetical protein
MLAKATLVGVRVDQFGHEKPYRPHFLDYRLTDGSEVVRLTLSPTHAPREYPALISVTGLFSPRQ